MSRALLFGLDNLLLWEFKANIDRSYTIDGHPSSSGGGSTVITIPDAVAADKRLNFGRMILVSHGDNNKLPSWAGMLDTPWKALLPAQVTAYNAEYLLSQRCPDQPFFLQAPLAAIAAEMINQANAQEEMYIRLGDTGGLDPTIRQETFDQRNFWEQLKALLLRAGAEMTVRPQREPSDGNRLYIYLDVKQRAGVDTGFLLHDGDNANIKVTAASVDGQIWNRVTGISGESTQASRQQTTPQISTDSQIYRTRSIVQQFRSVRENSTLLANAQTFLDQNKFPKLKLSIQVLDVGDAIPACAPGNQVLVHASKLWLPGGRQGWRGTMRLISMNYIESSNTLTADLEGTL